MLMPFSYSKNAILPVHQSMHYSQYSGHYKITLEAVSGVELWPKALLPDSGLDRNIISYTLFTIWHSPWTMILGLLSYVLNHSEHASVIQILWNGSLSSILGNIKWSVSCPLCKSKIILFPYYPFSFLDSWKTAKPSPLSHLSAYISTLWGTTKPVDF